MENKEIKKAWTKMSKSLKKQGIKFTCVMNARQQSLGTATIMFYYVSDKDVLIKRAQDRMANEQEDMKEARYSYAYMKQNRNLYDTLFIPKAKEKGDTDHLQYCLDACEAYDSGRFVEWEYERQRKDTIERCTKHIEKLQVEKSYSEQMKEAHEVYNDLISNSAVKEFMDTVGATVELEVTPDGDAHYKMYARFYY